MNDVELDEQMKSAMKYGRFLGYQDVIWELENLELRQKDGDIKVEDIPRILKEKLEDRMFNKPMTLNEYEKTYQKNMRKEIVGTFIDFKKTGDKE